MSIRPTVSLILALTLPLNAVAFPAHRPTRLSAETAHALYQTRLDAFIANFNERVKSKRDFDEIYLSSFPQRERRELRAELNKLGDIPTLSRQGDVMIYTVGDVQLPVEYVNYATNQVRVGGVSFTYDSSAPPGWQLRQFENAFARSLKKEHAAFLFSFLPRAEAAGIDTASRAMAEAMVRKAATTGAGRAALARIAKWGSLGVIVTGAANGMISSFLCFVTDKGTGIDPELVWGANCTLYNTRKDKSKSADFKTQVGYTDEVAKSLQLVRSGGKFDCTEFDPAKPEKPQIASGYIAEVESLAPGSSTSAAPVAKNWKLFKGSIVKGVLKEADVFNADGKDEKLLAHVTFNENPDNPLTVKLPQIDQKGVEQEPLDVPANIKKESMLLENFTKAQRMMFLAKTAQVWVKNCLTGQAEAKYLRVKGVSPSEVGTGK